MYYRLFCLTAFILSLLTGISSAQPTPSLPEIEGWNRTEALSAPLEAFETDHGYWQSAEYRTPDGLALKAVLTYGSGPKFFNQPAAGTTGSDGLAGDGAAYEIISVGGYKTSLESDPLLGKTLAVNAFNQKYTLTLECGRFETADDLIRAAETLIGEIEKTL